MASSVGAEVTVQTSAAAHDSDDEEITVVTQGAAGDGCISTGPTATHPVWDVYGAPDKDGKCKCKNCAYSTKRSHGPTNALNHVKRKHKPVFDDVTEKKRKIDEDRKSAEENAKRATQNQQPKITDYCGPKYSQNHPRMLKFMEKIARFFSSANVSLSAVENDEFIELIGFLDPRIQVPGRRALTTAITTLHEKTCQAVKCSLENGSKIAVAIDLWSMKGLTASFVGMNGTWFDFKSSVMQSALLSVVPISHPHTGLRIREIVQQILAAWNISGERVSRYLTDNGSNMLSGFRGEVLTVEGVADDEAMEPTHEFMFDANLEQEADEDIDEDVAEFENQEREVAVFSSRLSCFIHTLMLAGRNIVDKDKNVQAVKQSVYGVVQKYSKSSVAKQLLLQLQTDAGVTNPKVLLLPCTTRWNSTYLVLARFLDLKEFVVSMCTDERLNWPLPTDWSKITALRDFLQPLCKYTLATESDNRVTISRVIPTLKSLLIFYSDRERQFACFPSLAQEMKLYLEKRFETYLDFKTESVIDPTHILASFLDPAVANILIRDQKMSDFAVKKLKLLVSKQPLPAGPTSTPTLDHQSSGSSAIAEMFPLLFQNDDQNEPAPVESEQNQKDEVDAYWRLFPKHANQFDPFVFWCANREELPRLSCIAFDLLSIAASTAAVERSFSVTGLLSEGRRNRIGANLLEKLAMNRCNKKFTK